MNIVQVLLTCVIYFGTVCPRSLNSSYILSYYMNWVKAAWTYCSIRDLFYPNSRNKYFFLNTFGMLRYIQICILSVFLLLLKTDFTRFYVWGRQNTLIRRCWLGTRYVLDTRSSYPFYIVSYYIKLVTTSWTDSTFEQS